MKLQSELNEMRVRQYYAAQIMLDGILRFTHIKAQLFLESVTILCQSWLCFVE